MSMPLQRWLGPSQEPPKSWWALPPPSHSNRNTKSPASLQKELVHIPRPPTFRAGCKPGSDSLQGPYSQVPQGYSKQRSIFKQVQEHTQLLPSSPCSDAPGLRVQGAGSSSHLAVSPCSYGDWPCIVLSQLLPEGPASNLPAASAKSRSKPQ